MGREAKLLLALLGLLGGVFCGVLSMKLFVHRPPAGAGPDVRGSLAADTEPAAHRWPATERFALSAAAFAAAPPMTVAMDAARDSSIDSGEAGVNSAPIDEGRLAAGAEFPANSPARFAGQAENAEQIDRDAFVTAVAHEEPAEPTLDGTTMQSRGTRAVTSAVGVEPLGPVTPPRFDGEYVVQPGDSWWQVAERAYGDGRFYRALFAWNRAADPRVSLTQGTRLEIPPLDRLAAAWPRLVPR
ncbi:MAG: LysM peptidoglycan-binding domain-containing protein [Planctomycetia bacterium]|jgi:nucleoid-associated protein YgaU